VVEKGKIVARKVYAATGADSPMLWSEITSRTLTSGGSRRRPFRRLEAMKRFRFASAALALLALPTLGLSPRLAAQDEDETAKLYKEVVDSAVFIITPIPEKHALSRGSGSLIDKTRRYVLTNYHVVHEEDKIYVQFPVHLKSGEILKDKEKYMDRWKAGEAIKGTVLHRDRTRDLAIVRLDSLPATAKQVKLAKKSAETGTNTWNIGSPGAVSGVFSITGGQVRTVANEDQVVGSGSSYMRIKCKMVTATNPTNPGDSGGPLFNKNREQVAVTESGLGGDVQQVNLFVDVTEVRAFLAEKKIVLPDEESPGTPGKAPAVDPKSPAPAVPPAGAPSDADEKAATTLLSRAKIFADGEDNRPTYVAKLKDVMAKYPDTAAAKEAKKLLNALPK
jgi:S1-C subfamily serine protease